MQGAWPQRERASLPTPLLTQTGASRTSATDTGVVKAAKLLPTWREARRRRESTDGERWTNNERQQV